MRRHAVRALALGAVILAQGCAMPDPAAAERYKKSHLMDLAHPVHGYPARTGYFAGGVVGAIGLTPFALVEGLISERNIMHRQDGPFHYASAHLAGGCAWLVGGPFYLLSLPFEGAGEAEEPPGPEPRLVPTEAVCRDDGTPLPCRWVGDMPFVTVTVDGAGPYSFLLDTGTSACLIDPRLLQGRAKAVTEFRIVPRGQDPSGPAFDRWVRIDALVAGPAEFRGFDAAVVDFSMISRVAGIEIDGVLGYAAFWGALVTIDYPRREVRLSGGALPAADGVEVLDVESGLIPDVSLDLGSGPMRFVIDSGSGGDLRIPEWPEGAAFRSPPVANRRAVQFGGITSIQESARLAARFHIGRHVVRDPVAIRGSGSRILGSNILRHFRLTLDPARARVRFERDGTDEITSEPIHGIGARPYPDEHGWVMADLVPGGPADRAGVREGDRVLDVDGFVVGRFFPEEGWWRLGEPGGKVRLSLLRGGESIAIEVSTAPEVP